MMESSIVYNVKYMASSRTQMLIRITNINKPQIVSKMPDTAICYIHCQAQLIMKIFELRPVENLKDNDNPWEPWYDKSFGFIVRAENEAEARKIANENAGDENRGEFLNSKTANTKTPWLDEKYSTCIELVGDGDAGMIMQDFARA